MVSFGGGGFKGIGSFGPGGRAFRVEFERSSPGPYAQMRDLGVAVRGASVEAIHRTTVEIKERIRDYIDAHFTGSEVHSNNRRRVSNASAQDTFYDEVDSKGQYAGLVYSKFGKRDAGGFVDFLLLRMRGGVLTPRRKSWLRIANTERGGTAPSAAQAGFYPISQRDIFFVESADGKKLFQLRRTRRGGSYKGKRADRTELLATLVKRLAFPATLTGIDEIARRRPDLFDGYFAQELKLRGVEGDG